MMLLAGGWKNENPFQLYLFIPDLPSFRIHMVTVTVNQFRDGNNFISLPFQVGNQGIQGIRCKFCSVMAQMMEPFPRCLLLHTVFTMESTP